MYGTTHYSRLNWPNIGNACPVESDLLRYESEQVRNERIAEEKQDRIEYEMSQLSASRSDWLKAITESGYSDGELQIHAHQSFKALDDAEFGRLMRQMINHELRLMAESIVEDN